MTQGVAKVAYPALQQEIEPTYTTHTIEANEEERNDDDGEEEEEEQQQQQQETTTYDSTGSCPIHHTPVFGSLDDVAPQLKRKFEHAIVGSVSIIIL